MNHIHTVKISFHVTTLVPWCLVFEGSERSFSIGCRNCTASTRHNASRSLVDESVISVMFTWSWRAKDSQRCCHTGELFTCTTMFTPGVTYLNCVLCWRLAKNSLLSWCVYIVVTDDCNTAVISVVTN